MAVRSSRRRRHFIAWPLTFLIAAFMLWALRYRNLEYASWTSAILGAIAVVVGLVMWAVTAPRPGASSGEQIALAQENLARLSRRHWRDEVTLRQLRAPQPIAVRWQSTALDQAYDIAQLSAATVSGTSDEVAQPAAAIDALPGKRVAIIGPRGSGKSTLALLLVVTRLSSWVPGQAIPVLLSASTWDPRRENLRQWLQRRLGEDYPALKDAEVYGSSVLSDLVAGRLIVPVLDGLDELPAGRLGLAMRALNQEFDSTDPIILTCRTQEYLRAVERFGVFSSAPVIEPQPISASDAAAYLRGIPARPGQHEAWQRVFTVLADHPDGALYHALSTPLMVTLARIAYSEPNADPAELLAFPGRSQIEDHLLDFADPEHAAYRGTPRCIDAGHKTQLEDRRHRTMDGLPCLPSRTIRSARSGVVATRSGHRVVGDGCGHRRRLLRVLLPGAKDRQNSWDRPHTHRVQAQRAGPSIDAQNPAADRFLRGCHVCEHNVHLRGVRPARDRQQVP